MVRFVSPETLGLRLAFTIIHWFNDSFLLLVEGALGGIYPLPSGIKFIRSCVPPDSSERRFGETNDWIPFASSLSVF